MSAFAQEANTAEQHTDEPHSKDPRQLKVRYDGHAKVTGKAKYAYEFPVKGVVHGVLITSTIASGKVTAMDIDAASKLPGVLKILTPFNAPRLPQPRSDAKPPGSRSIELLQDTEVHYSAQPIGVVVAETLVQAQYAASRVKVSYAPTAAKLEFTKRLGEARESGENENPTKGEFDSKRGDMAKALADAAVKVDVVYTTPIQHHNPMEPHATLAWWDGPKLNVYNATQYISGSQQSLAKTLGVAIEDVHVECPYTGGGFGSKGTSWNHVYLACMAAKAVGKPVKIALERPQMFGPVGERPRTHQHLQLAADKQGKLLGVQHDVICNQAIKGSFVEQSALPTRMLYASDANVTSHRILKTNTGQGTYMRAPGEATGTVGLECAMDELAHQLKVDPVELRMINYTEVNPEVDKPFTSKHLKECYQQAGERFGWSKRNAEPGQMREGKQLIGYGMATATYPANRSEAGAIVRLLPDGRVFVGSGSQDLGTGTYTIMAQTAADGFGIDPKLVDVKLGDSNLPKAPVSGGSQSAASVCPAITDACGQVIEKAKQMAVGDARSSLHGLDAGDLEMRRGRLVSRSDASKSEDLAELVKRNGQPIEANGEGKPSVTRGEKTAHSFGAVFAEVGVDVDTHMVEVRRIVGTYDIGTLMNRTTGLNQLVGGIVWGVSMALEEDTHLDTRYGRFVNMNLAEYHVPVNRDIGSIDVNVIGIPDTKFNPLGARGIGEIGITGSAAAVANAVFNATGKRVREFPITLDKIMMV